MQSIIIRSFLLMSSFEINQENIGKLIETSKNAGEAIMQIYDTNFDIEIKKNSSPLTKADLESHKIITTSLREITPNIPIISEESSDIEYEERMTWSEYWLIDPLDGTKEFINKNGDFTTNIALIYENRPIFGLIHAPAIDETYWGSEVDGSYFLKSECIKDKERILVSRETDAPLKIITSRSHPSDELSLKLKKLDDCEVLNVGSSLKFCKIARNKANCYPRLGPTSEWDIAAGDAVLSFAGGGLISLDGKTIKYNMKESYINPNFIAYSEKRFADIFLKK